MPKYFIRPARIIKAYYDVGEWEYDYGSGQSITVQEQEYETATGIYDHEGNEYCRQREPIGFNLEEARTMKAKPKGGKKPRC